MPKIAGPELVDFLREHGLLGKVRQDLAETECYICKLLFGEHSQEEFNAHALIGSGIEVNAGPIGPPTPHGFLHFLGHKCMDCDNCEECITLLDEPEKALLRARREKGFLASDECPECGKLFGQHNSQEIKTCKWRIILKLK